jgi:hypothetical protein
MENIHKEYQRAYNLLYMYKYFVYQYISIKLFTQWKEYPCYQGGYNIFLTKIYFDNTSSSNTLIAKERAQSITKATARHHSATHPSTIASSRTITIRDLAESVNHPIRL